MVFYVHLTGLSKGQIGMTGIEDIHRCENPTHIFSLMKPQVECFGQLDECASPFLLIEIFSIFVCETVATSAFLSTITEHENEPRHVMFRHVCSINVADCKGFFCCRSCVTGDDSGIEGRLKNRQFVNQKQ